MLFNDEKFEEFGIITRASKGAELSHEEMDNNVRVGLDVMLFDDISWGSAKEYATILNAPILLDPATPVTVTPKNGYSAIKLDGASLAGQIVSMSPSPNDYWFYDVNMESRGDSQSPEVDDIYFVCSSTVLVTFSLVAGSGAGSGAGEG